MREAKHSHYANMKFKRKEKKLIIMGISFKFSQLREYQMMMLVISIGNLPTKQYFDFCFSYSRRLL